MDLIKIGKYIAAKRKEAGMTQKQLAEKLGMSDKSVSKWERGICLPDVSVYMELCNILGISINEFLAGEDISKDNIIKASEDNLLQISADSKKRQNNLKKIIALLSAAVLLAAVPLSIITYHTLNQPHNYITAVPQESAEMKTAQLLSGIDGAFLYRYKEKSNCETLDIYMTEYRSGTQTAREKVAELSYSGLDSTGEGMIALVPDFDRFEIRLTVTDDYAKYSTTIPILENVENIESYGRTASQIEDIIPIQYNREQGLAAFICGKNGVSATPVSDIEQGTDLSVNDYVYYFSFQFNK